MRFVRAKGRYFDREHRLSRWLHDLHGRPLPPDELGRLGGEMAKRMLEAGLAYLVERAATEARFSFHETAFKDHQNAPSGEVTGAGPKA